MNTRALQLFVPMIAEPHNASILSGIYECFKKSKRDEECEKIIRFSPVAWQHINLIGTYEFGNEDKVVNLQEVI